MVRKTLNVVRQGRQDDHVTSQAIIGQVDRFCDPKTRLGSSKIQPSVQPSYTIATPFQVYKYSYVVVYRQESEWNIERLEGRQKPNQG
jgi:hypothetical protein